MGKSSDVTLEQLKTAVLYLSWVLDEGSLVPELNAIARQELSLTLKLLLEKVADLPAAVPQHLTQAVAVRALITARETLAATADTHTPTDKQAALERNMRQAELAVGTQGHTLAPWQPAGGGEPEFEAMCQQCDGVVYANQTGFYNLMPEECPGQKTTTDAAIDEETLVALWDLSQKEE